MPKQSDSLVYKLLSAGGRHYTALMSLPHWTRMLSASLCTRVIRLLLAACVAASCLAAHAQTAQLPNSWIYINASGIKTYSDLAPPAGTPEKNILKRPGGLATRAIAAASGLDAPASAPTPGASSPRISGRDSALEARLKAKAADDQKKKDVEAANAKIEEESANAQRKQSCERHEKNAMALQSENRIARINAKGEREFLSDEQRAQELRQAKSNLAECGKG